MENTLQKTASSKVTQTLPRVCLDEKFLRAALRRLAYLNGVSRATRNKRYRAMFKVSFCAASEFRTRPTRLRDIARLSADPAVTPKYCEIVNIEARSNSVITTTAHRRNVSDITPKIHLARTRRVTSGWFISFVITINKKCLSAAR